MAVTEVQDQKFVYFTKDEDKLIVAWLKDQGYSYGHNTTCGDCCGMYEDKYWVNGVGGEFPKEKQLEFFAYAKENNIGCNIDGYTIQARDGEPVLEEG